MNEPSVGFEIDAFAQIAENVWIFDDAPINAAGLRLPIRMTIIRLTGGNLLLHSPTRYSSKLHKRLEGLGTIKYLLAPSIGHWMFLPQWQRALPDAITLAAPGLGARRQVREAGVRIDRELFEGSPEEWADEIETVLVSAPLFAETALFHKPSRSLVLTDLVQNVRPKELPYGSRIAAELLGITAPNGRAPLYLRLLLLLGGRAAEQAAARLIRFKPERVVFAHGDWFETDATERLRRSLQWLLSRADRANTAQGTMIEGSPAGATSRVAIVAGLAVVTLGAVALLRRRRWNSA